MANKIVKNFKLSNDSDNLYVINFGVDEIIATLEQDITDLKNQLSELTNSTIKKLLDRIERLEYNQPENHDKDGSSFDSY